MKTHAIEKVDLYIRDPSLFVARGGFGEITWFSREERRGSALIDSIGTKGGPGKKGEHHLKRWDQFITFFMILFTHELI